MNLQTRAAEKTGGTKNSSAFLKATVTTLLHTINESEKASYVSHINNYLGEDPFLKKYLPLDPATNGLFDLVKDGVLLWYDVCCQDKFFCCYKLPRIDSPSFLRSFLLWLIIIYFAFLSTYMIISEMNEAGFGCVNFLHQAETFLPNVANFCRRGKFTSLDKKVGLFLCS